MGKYINKKKIDNSTILSWMFRQYTKYRYKTIPDKEFVEMAYKRQFNKNLDWQNPVSYQEKLQWLKINHRLDLQTQCADKVAVRDYVKEKIGEQYLIPQPMVFDSVKELVPDELPNVPFIIKCNHNSAGYTIVRDKTKINWKNERKKFDNLLKQNYYYQSREWQYKNIAPKIIIEELLLDEQNNIPLDYKFYCYNGEPKNIHVSIKRDGVHYVIFYDLDWNKIPLKYYDYPNDGGFEIERPRRLKEMEELATVLSSHYPFVRVDFYHNKNEIFFGEITYHPGSGLLPYSPKEYNKLMGDWINLENL
ncbi:glycosyl transferase [Flagellimonas sp. 389]|uniref:ATP-grasp fold amidoligase family protein n=1 Tax=Flagellimonas sp. 389 TaxID=2835862 RepID=UPI001BD54B1A|nr:ATP-grasp fold amidoligase family protein [Flagellimonas sp. 389]MBS9462199.1 glycosyl transferase [Flagellimonas sp. 389]